MRLVLSFLATLLAVAAVPDLAYAQTDAASGSWGIALGAGLAIGLGALGCGIGQGIAGANAVQGIARNPGAAGAIQTPMIIALALIESISLYAFVIAFQLQGKI